MTNGMTKSRELKLIRLAAKGDLDAASALIKAHQGSVFAYIRRLCGREDIAEDTTQEAFARVLLNLDRFDPKYRFSTWLFTIARRIMINIMTKLHPVYDSERLGAAPGTGDVVGTRLEQSESNGKAKDLLQRALMVLSADQREIVVLFHQHEWPIWMIADQLDVPEGTVKSHLFRGRMKLRDEYLRLEALDAQQRAAAAQRSREGVMRMIKVNDRSSIMQAVDEAAADLLGKSAIVPAIAAAAGGPQGAGGQKDQKVDARGDGNGDGGHTIVQEHWS
jgi:RNA polymerase sigma-70 factor (ECF subfamily)